MSFFVEVESASLIKTGEELCGDSVAIIRAEDSFIAVLSDGLGSGVKASILSTLTGKIASTMLEKGSSLEDVVYTLVQTLPVCKVRGLAYATFTVVQIFKDGQIYVAESDNPELLFFRDGINRKIPRKETVIENKLIYESSFQLVEGDTLVIISDGVINAGIGGIRPLGWPLEEIASEIEEIFLQKRSNVKAKEIAIHIKDRCQEFYRSQIGDDTTALVL
ncbi:MAG TPA: SpoIIE family protein phosphatase, partial [Firmicutes bacterium]|nr:SpoIIE family protein phosphatase [Bacillota bacterium]